jgi:TPR repeat protein
MPAPVASSPAVSANDRGTGPIVASLQGNGSEELAVAESYLNGTRGRARDTSEAAKWLWRSFGKQNGAAALLLSDLYVHGDGVPQSCDQARLLLDAAARKGTPGATQRLTNLPSLGCQ